MLEVFYPIFTAESIRILLRRRVTAFHYALVATAVIIGVYTLLIQLMSFLGERGFSAYSGSGSADLLAYLWVLLLAASPLVVLLLTGIFARLDITHERANQRLKYVLRACAVFSIIFVILFACSLAGLW